MLSENKKIIGWNVLAIIAAFCTYYCMYAFRKPFAVLEFEGTWLGTAIGLKSVIVISQILGYTASKFLGCRVCSGLHRERILPALLACIGVAELALLALPFLPTQWGIIPMFINGLALGMVWGIVVRPLEGRQTSELLMAALCCSFIVASGDVKTTGKRVLEADWFSQLFGNNELWMPSITGLIYLLPFLIAAWCLSRIPKPSSRDIEDRSDRKAMNADERRAFVWKYIRILAPLALVYFFLTAYRDYRDNFQADMLLALGENGSDLFSDIERKVAFTVLGVMALIMLFRQHINALRATFVVMLLGIVTCVVSTFLRQNGGLDAQSWMVATGIGGYLCYIPFNCIIFERFVAHTKSAGNAVFAIMLFDGIGYIGSICMLMVADLISGGSPLAAFDLLNYALGATCLAALIWCFLHVGRYNADDPSALTEK